MGSDRQDVVDSCELPPRVDDMELHETMADTTQLLLDARRGDPEAWDLLFEHVYDELRRVARAQLRREARKTLATTELVHEAYVKLFDEHRVDAEDRIHFLSLAARAMRQILVDRFRRRQAEKRGAGRVAVDLDQAAALASDDGGAVILAVDDALRLLAARDDRLAKLVELKFFGGLTEPEIATALGVSVRTVSSDWRRAKAWLALDLGLGEPGDG